jgi:hypothetical protein
MIMTPTTAKAQNCTPAAEYRTDAPREDGWTYQRQATFLMALAETGLVSAACKIAEMSPASAYALRREARGIAFHLGWQAAHLLARDRLEDVLLEAAINGVESVTQRAEGISHRRSLNGNLSMAVLNRLDRRAAALDDRAMAVARSICAAFEDYISLVLAGGGAEEITAFLAQHPDPLAAQVTAYQSADSTQSVIPAKAGIHILPKPEIMDSRLRGSDGVFAVSTPAPQLVEESAIFSATPCACPADRDTPLYEAA